MREKETHRLMFLAISALIWGALPSGAEIVSQCNPLLTVPAGEKKVCKHIASGDGFIRMADGHVLYTFGFSDVTGLPDKQVFSEGALAANFPAPLIVLDEGDHFFLSLSNVSLIKRPDLFDPHTVHYHGFPQTGAIFDGLPESAIAINPNYTATYYYKAMEPGTFMYHCHAEATEHMQMGMLGNLYVRPRQNGTSFGSCGGGAACTKFAYNDGDGSTGYDVDLALQISSMDGPFHDQHIAVQPLPFAEMKDNYPLLNGRGYPDTVNPEALTPPTENGGKFSQSQTALITASVGQKILLRLSNLNVTNTYSITVLGIPMQVVGRDAKILRGPTGISLYQTVNSLSLGSGETADVILDTTGLTVGTYMLYATQLNFLSNDKEDFGGMMTEIHLTL